MVTDFHSDFLTSKNYVDKIQNYNASKTRIVAALFRGNFDIKSAVRLCESLKSLGGKNLFLGFEDFGYQNDVHDLEIILHKYNPLYVGLTWNGENNLAFGSYVSGRLKPRGRRIIDILNEVNVFIDVAHLCSQCVYDVADCARNILCSHTCFSDVYEHPRNLSKNEISLIVEREGLVGLTLYSKFLSDKIIVTVDDVYAHIDYFLDKFSEDHLAIGTDFYGCNDFPVGFLDYSFEYRLTDYLVSRGYGYQTIEKILHKNLDGLIFKKYGL